MQVNQIQIKTKDDREVFSLHERDGVSWLSSSSFDQLPGIHMAIATRFGGVSEGMYSTLNFSVSQGDDPARVRENFIRFGRAIGLPAEQMVLSQQTHTTNLRYCSVEDGGKGILRERGYTDIDGLYTDHNGVGLVISFADCVPVLLYDPVQEVVAAVHAGWRGTVGHIVGLTLQKMREEDPTWQIEQSKELRQILVHGQGEFHLRTLKWRMENNDKIHGHKSLYLLQS